MVLLPDTPRPGALHVAESLRRQLEETSVTWQGKKVSTTASVGLAMALPKEVSSSVLRHIEGRIGPLYGEGPRAQPGMRVGAARIVDHNRDLSAAGVNEVSPERVPGFE